MRLLSGDECGLIKEIIPEIGRPEKKDIGPTNVIANQVTVDKGIHRINPSTQQSRSRGVLAMTWMEKKGQFSALLANSSIEVWEGSYRDSVKKPGSYKLSQTMDSIWDSKDESQPVKALGYSKGLLCACNSQGNISIVDPNKTCVVSTYSAYSSSKQGNEITYTKGRNHNSHMASAMASSHDGKIAIGGREREIVTLDISNGNQIWKAKNLPPDPQTLLQQPVWSTALTFLSNDLLLSGTAYKQVRLYDMRSNTRRPVSFTPDGLLEHRVTTLCGYDENKYIVGDAAGYMSEIDMRFSMGKKSMKSTMITAIPRFVGPAGSIRQIIRHPTKSLIACVGLDRMLRTYHAQTRRQLDCVYLKQRLNCALFCDDDEWSSSKGNEETGTNDDQDLDVEDDVQDYVESDEESSDVPSDKNSVELDSQQSGDDSSDSQFLSADEDESAEESDGNSDDSSLEGDEDEDDETVSNDDDNKNSKHKIQSFQKGTLNQQKDSTSQRKKQRR
jgi:ribosome biogenesis protein NSA1